MSTLKFCNNGFLSPIDLITMGDSEKRDDSSKIGQFSSGLKYAISLFLIHDVKCFISSGDKEYTFGTKVLSIGQKTKEVIVIKELCKSSFEEKEYVTGFAKNMALHWELWMAFREIYSNTLDENGVVILPNENSESVYDTMFEITVDNKVQGILDSWGNYFVSEEHIISNHEVKVLPSVDGALRVYKQGILIYEDLDQKALFSYDFIHACIDERRILNDHYGLRYAVANCFSKTTDKKFIEDLLTMSSYPKAVWEENLSLDYFSEEWVQVANGLKQSDTPIVTVGSFFSSITKDNRFNVGVRNLKVDSHWFASTVTVTELPKEETKDSSIKGIISKYVFGQEFEIKLSSMSGSIKAIADLHNKCIFVAENFTEEDMWQYTKAHVRLLTNGKNDDEIFKLYTEKIRK